MGPCGVKTGGHFINGDGTGVRTGPGNAGSHVDSGHMGTLCGQTHRMIDRHD